MESRLITKKVIYIYIYIFFFFGCVSLSETCLALGWIGHNLSLFLLLSQTYVLGNVRSELFFVYGCRLFTFFMLFLFFYSRHLYFYLFYIISKGIFHLGGLVSKMHISVYGLFTEWKCFCFLFFLFFAFIVYNLGIMNIQCIL